MSVDNQCSWYDASCGFSWLVDEIYLLLVEFYSLIISGFASVVESIPVPSFLENMTVYQMPPAVSWAAEPFHISHGMGIMVAAYTARFVLRRIPGIG